MEQEFVLNEESLQALDDALGLAELRQMLVQSQQHVAELTAYLYTVDRRVQQLLGEPVVTQKVTPGYGKNGISLDIETSYGNVPSAIVAPR